MLRVNEVESRSSDEEVRAGQVRMARETAFQHKVVVLIIDAINSPAGGTEDAPYIAVVLDSSEPSLVSTVEQNLYTDSAEKIKELFPIVLDAELTVKEVE